MFEARENNINSDLIDKIYVQGIQSGIKPIASIGYESRFFKAFVSVAKNIILFAPKTSFEKLTNYEHYLKKLHNSEVLIDGLVTNTFHYL